MLRQKRLLVLAELWLVTVQLIQYFLKISFNYFKTLT
jgi:hypothetical protein